MPDLKLLNLGCGNRYHQDWVNVDIVSSSAEVLALDLRQVLPFEDASFDVVYHSHLLEHLPKAYVPMFCHECFRVLKPGGIIRMVVPDLEQIAKIYLELLNRALAGDKIAQNRYDWIILEMFDQMVRNESGGEMKRYWMQESMPAEDFVLSRVGSEVVTFINQLRTSGNKEASSGDDVGLINDCDAIGKFRLSGEIHQWMYDRYSLIRLMKDAGFINIEQRRADESSIPGFNSYQLDLEQDGAVRKPDSLFMEAVKPLKEIEADRIARLERVCRLNVEIQKDRSNSPVKHGLIHDLESRLRQSEEDRAARLELIHKLDAQLRVSQSERDKKSAAVYRLEAQLKESEEDRAARLELIHKLDAQLKKSEAVCSDLALELSSIKSSFEWKVTTPLRWLRKIFMQKQV